MDAISFGGQEKGSSPNTGRVQILWRRKASTCKSNRKPSGNSTANKDNREGTKFVVCRHTNLDSGDSPTAQIQ
jgi:hypothetical protein